MVKNKVDFVINSANAHVWMKLLDLYTIYVGLLKYTKDPFPTKFFMSYLSSITLRIENLPFSSGVFQHLVSPPSFFL